MKLLALGSVVPRGDGPKASARPSAAHRAGLSGRYGRPYVGSKRGVLEKSLELAGDVADQRAFDLAVGLALGAPALGIGPGRRVIAQPGQDDEVQRLVELAVPGAVEPNPHGLAAGGRDRGGAAQDREAASLGQRPACNQVHSTLAATIGPTPCWRSRSGRQARTSVVMAPVCSAISRSSSCARRAKAGRLAAVAVVSASQSPRWRSCPQVPVSCWVVKPRRRPRSTSGAAAPARAAAVERRWRPGPPSGVPPAAPTTPLGAPLPLARRAGHGPAPHGPPWWHRSGRTWRHAGGRRAWPV
jgi:hypothetical protein